ncbi:LPS export ABC transporter periplasmic protein LptC [Leucothrix pacifica]|uniref:LPS export ABC transporter periplasmic protein LptC n=1 Tax=Leucothrix pacifica TaxID=1247513 RepID=A0A317CFK2_9GAMM|nr:LPS export ABC transporter periplasmic protein LptC [Leucothrix pacifica]PWQ94952.1 LPS export ABC transporter periplasmic protein LptC [Leucothrix pacifica]
MKNIGRLLFVLSLIVAAVVTWLNLSWKSIEQLTNSPSESRIDYYLSDFTLMKTNESGSIDYQLNGRHLTHKQASGATEIYQPRIRMRSDDGQIMTVVSEKALQQAKDDSITLSGDVLVKKVGTSSSPEFTLSTEDLLYNPQQRLISTTAAIQFNSAAGTLKGTGFETSLDEQELRILSNVQAEFQATQ